MTTREGAGMKFEVEPDNRGPTDEALLDDQCAVGKNHVTKVNTN